MNHKPDPSSFRDPSGFIFEGDGNIYRAIAPSYFENFALLESSGLYKKLTDKKLLVAHTPVTKTGLLPDELSAYSVIQPEKVPFISYPYEWCFSELKKAALLTLAVQREALMHDMTLKDATAYNVQFIGPRPIFIDTLSFEKYTDGTPWTAYGQFCRHFIAPLALISYRHPGLSKLSQLFLDGIPLELADTVIPRRSLANSVVLSHLHIHAKFQRSAAGNDAKKRRTATISKKKLLALIDHMEGGIKSFSLKETKSTWNNYDETHNYSAAGKKEKERVIAGWMEKIKPHTTWDLGCNTGEYSLLASKHSGYVLSLDSDHFCIERLFNVVSKSKTGNILPLEIDLCNPSPGIGWNNRERKTLDARGKADLLLALALVHHLRISNNTPWSTIAELFSQWGEHLILEFISKEDSQIQKMLSQREDIFHDLNTKDFEKAFGKYFNILETVRLPDPARTLYLLKRNTA